jgi:peptidoglycan hydrolase-like protein with peptidoglycan-binding domain
VTQRRSMVCAYLGIGDCDGKQLQRQLNRYGFTSEEVERALTWAGSQDD